MTFKKAAALFFATTCLAGPFGLQQASATQVAPSAQEENVEERIITSVKIKMRSQSIAASTCHLQVGVDAGALSAPMDTQIAELDQFVAALINGDPSLNIVQPETRKKTHAMAQRVTDAWMPVKAAAQSIASGNGQAADADVILAGNLEILEQGHQFTAELVQQYSNPAKATLADLMTIVLAMRQGMLSQKMSKQACLVSYTGGDAAKELGKTIDIFDATLDALRHGMPAAGIGGPPTPAVAASLEEAASQWAAVKPVLLEAKSGATLSADVHMGKMKQLDALTAKMLEVSDHYADFTRNKVK